MKLPAVENLLVWRMTSLMGEVASDNDELEPDNIMATDCYKELIVAKIAIEAADREKRALRDLVEELQQPVEASKDEEFRLIKDIERARKQLKNFV
jgi:hypothetical protein